MNLTIKYFFACLIFFSSCSGHLTIEQNDNPQGYADSQLVGNWKVTGYISDKAYDWNGDGRAETNIFNTWTTCEKENLYQFASDKTGLYKINCSVTSPGTWHIINTQYLFYQLTGQPSETEKFISMTSIEFKTTKEITVSTGQSFVLIKTWSRQ